MVRKRFFLLEDGRAEKLGLPQVTYLEQVVELRDKVARLRRNIGNGWEVVEVRLPVLVTVLDTAGRVRPPAAKRVMKFKKARTPMELKSEVSREQPDATDDEKETEVVRRAERLRARGLMLEQWNLDDVAADLDWCGLSGSPTKVYRVQSIVLTKEGYTEIESTDDGIRRLIDELVADHTLD